MQNLEFTKLIAYFATLFYKQISNRMKRVIGNNLRMLREKFHYTHEDIANYLGIERGTYANYDCGNREMPYELIMKVCELYGLSLSDIFEENTSKLEAELVCCFRTDSLAEQDRREITRFKNVVRNYLKLAVS